MMVMYNTISPQGSEGSDVDDSTVQFQSFFVDIQTHYRPKTNMPVASSFKQDHDFGKY
jgi:hypothetical protein